MRGKVASTLAPKLRRKTRTSAQVLAGKEKKFSQDEPVMIANPAERRRFPRIRLQVPMFIRGRDARGEEYLDLTKTLDISAAGAFLTTERSIRADDIVSLTIPAPPSPSSGLVPASTPPIQARVRRLQSAGEALLVGVEFLKPLG